MLGEKVALADAMEELEGAQVTAQTRLPGPFVREPVRAFVAHDADVGRNPFNVNMPVFECVVIEFAHSAHKCAISFGVVVFSDGNGCVCAVSE